MKRMSLESFVSKQKKPVTRKKYSTLTVHKRTVEAVSTLAATLNVTTMNITEYLIYDGIRRIVNEDIKKSPKYARKSTGEPIATDKSKDEYNADSDPGESD